MKVITTITKTYDETKLEEIMQEANELKEKFDKAVEVTTLPEKIDYDTINNILLKARDIAYSKQINSSDLKTMK